MTPYLYEHENRHAPVRGNGRRFWGHPSRQGGLPAIRNVVIHTAETTPDLTPPDPRAENVAAFQSRTDRPSSYHRIVDSDSTVLCLPDEAVAFGARGANTIGLHLSFATYAAMWAELPEAWIAGALGQGADVGREWTARYRLPLVRLSPAEYRAGKRGFVAHGDVDPGRRSDPGDDFPWARFLDLSRHPHPPLDEEDDVVFFTTAGTDLVWLLAGNVRIRLAPAREADQLDPQWRKKLRTLSKDHPLFALEEVKG